MSLLCSQEPATGPYPEPTVSNSQPIIPLLKIHFNITLASTLASSK